MTMSITTPLLSRGIYIVIFTLAFSHYSYGDVTSAVDEYLDRDDKFNQATSAYRNGDYVNAVNKFLEGAEKGDPRAMYAVGSMYAGGAGIEQDFGKAYQWLNKAAIYNRWDAQYKTGLLHYMGMGVPRNYKKAALVYRTLAVKEKGYPPAQYRLGLLYVKGHGVEQNNIQAYAWLVIAAHFYRHVIAREEQGLIASNQGLKEMDETEQIAFELATVTDPIASVFANIHINDISKVLTKIRSEMRFNIEVNTRRQISREKKCRL
jgi:hypothetical protein